MSGSASEELNAHVWQAIEHDLQAFDLTTTPMAIKQRGVDLLAQPGQENVPKTDSQGRLRNETKRWVDLHNKGDVDANGVSIESDTAGVFVGGGSELTVIHAGQSRRFPLMLSLAAADPTIMVRWVESGEAREKKFHIG